MDLLQALSLKELKAETDRLRELAYKLDIHPIGHQGHRNTYITFLNRCIEAGLRVSESSPGVDRDAADEAALGAIDRTETRLAIKHSSQPQVSHKSATSQHRGSGT